MADQVAAFQAWLSGALGVPCYVEGDVPAGQELPYATHRMQTGEFGDSGSVEVDVWCQQGRAADADALCSRLRVAIGHGGEVVPCDGGAMWLRRGLPFSQPVPDERAERRYLNVDIDYLTSD